MKRINFKNHMINKLYDKKQEIQKELNEFHGSHIYINESSSLEFKVGKYYGMIELLERLLEDISRGSA